MVHTPIKIEQAYQSPGGKIGMDKEWNQLIEKEAWVIDTVRERGAVKADAEKKGITVHFAKRFTDVAKVLF